MENIVTFVTRWRTFAIGGITPKGLLIKVRAGSSVDGRAEGMIKDRAFTTQGVKEEVETAILTPADFGYECMPTTTELLDPERLALWSGQNARRLPEGYFVGLLPAEAGPHICDQYKDQPRGEVLRIAMERITLMNGYSHIFVLRRGDNDVQLLSTSWAGPACQWGLNIKFVYQLVRV